jgi:hypothetical protein
MAMNPFSAFFGGASRTSGGAYLPDIFPMPVNQYEFVKADIETIYSKILTDVFDRTEGLSEEQVSTLWDSCLQSEASEGLITLLAKSMEKQESLYIVYKLGVVRKATASEMREIQMDYRERGSSAVGVYVSFEHYQRTKMVRLYSSLEYAAICSLYKGVGVSRAVQYKINDLRASVSLIDSEKAKSQASEIAEALSRGKDVYLDAKDEITSHKPDLDATEKTIEFLDSKRCFYLGMPRSYVNGETSGGLGDSGVGDAKAVERGLKNYFVSIVRPISNAIFGAKVTFRPSDMTQINSALEALKTFELVGDSYLDAETKGKIINQLFGF